MHCCLCALVWCSNTCIHARMHTYKHTHTNARPTRAPMHTSLAAEPAPFGATVWAQEGGPAPAGIKALALLLLNAHSRAPQPPWTSSGRTCYWWGGCDYWNNQNCYLQHDGSTFAVYACSMG